jgi:VWFA-related protein
MYDHDTDTWTDSTEYLPNRGGKTGTFNSQNGYDLIIDIHPENGNIVFVGGRNLWRLDMSSDPSNAGTWIGGYTSSNDGFGFYNPSGSDSHHPDQHILAFESGNSDVMYVGSDGGIHRTDDNMAETVQWTSLNAGYQTNQFYTVCAHPTDQRIAGGMQDNGSVSTSPLSPQNQWVNELGGDGGYCEITDNDDTGTSRYISSQNGVVYRYIYDTNGNRDDFTRVDPQGASGQLFINPFELDPSAQKVMYYADGDSLWRNSNLEGIDLGSHDPTSTNWTDLTGARIAQSDNITAITASRSNDPHVLYYGTDNGEVYRLDNAHTTAASTSPTPVTGSGFPSGGFVSSIAIHPENSDRAIVTFSNYGVTNVFHTTDGGNNWKSVEGNLEGPNKEMPSVRSAAILPASAPGQNQDEYLLGTSVGAYSTKSFPGGGNTTWKQEGSSQVGNVVVDDILARPDDGLVVAATHGNGMYALGGGTLADLNITINEVQVGFFPTITSVVTVTESNGDVVTGLDESNFSVREEGALETIIDVNEIQESGGNVSSSLVLDRSGSMGGGELADAKEAAKTFVDQLRVGDQASVISFSDGVRVDQPFTSDVEALKSAINGLFDGGGTALYDGIIQGIEEIELEANSPAVLALTDGKENESSNSKQDAIDLANQAGVPVYTIGLGSNINADDLQDVADQTGGRFFQAPSSSDLETIYQEISQQLSSRYEVTYLTTNVLLNGMEQEVEVMATAGGEATGSDSETYTAPSLQIPFVPNLASNPDPGGTTQAGVNVGSQSQPADDLFRATFTVEYDAENLDVVSDGPGSFLGSDVEYRSTISDSTGTIDIGIRKKTGNGASLKNILAKRSAVEKVSQDQGTLAQIEFSADQDAPSGKNYNLGVNNVSAADADGNPIAAEVAPTLLSPTTEATSVLPFLTLDWKINGTDQEYRAQVAAESSFQSVEVDQTTSSTELSLQRLDKGATYFWRVRAENAENGPWSDVSRFTTRSAELQADVSRTFGDASEAEDYELVALPGAVDRPLESAIGGEAGLNWQAFWDDGSSENYLQEFDESAVFSFRPGRGFWVTSTDAWSLEEQIETVDLRPDTTYAIALHEGWNIISNPFRESVLWENVEAATGDSLQALWRFDGSFTRTDTFASARSGEAFYFLNDRGLDSLTVPYPNATSPDTGGTEASTERLALTARPRGEEKPASTVRVGFAEDAKEGLGRGDVVAPPSRFSAVSLRLKASGDVADRKRLLAVERRSLRTETGGGTTFDLRLRTNTEGPIRLSTSGLNAVENRKVALLNSSTGQSYDLRAQRAVTLQSVDSTALQLAIGSAAFVKDKRQSVVPDEVTLTSYPNPLRRQATVAYTLPEASDVRIAVYDMLGRQVAVLENGRREAGRHRVTLDGDRLASGVYFGRLRVGQKTLTQKITVVR